MQQLPTAYQQFIFMSRYSRWIEAENRRETWPEAVKRYFDFMVEFLEEKHNYKISADMRRELESAVLNLHILPSMRALMTAGPALKRDNICGYNCAYLPIDDLRAFDESLVILMSGTGVGFSVEERYTSKLPTISEHFERTGSTIKVEDSKAGWGRALRELLALLVAGQIPAWDVTELRPAGARLKVMGGRSSGPEPLVSLFSFCVQLFTGAKGRRLTSLECHDLVCKIAEIVVVGGVRRSALISLSDIDDVRIRNAKSGQWWQTHSHRALANNSAVHPDSLPLETFIDEWKALYLSGSGERGIFSRAASDRIVRSNGRREPGQEWGTNPCSEIILRPNQFCNLTSVICRSGDNLDVLKWKVQLAAILGTWQSCLTNFKYLRKRWKDNCEEERLLGVSLNGIMDAYDVLQHSEWLQQLKGIAINANKVTAASIGIAPSAAITCVKPEGTTSQLVNCPSGLHGWYADYYIRRVRQDNKDPVTAFLKASGVPNEPCAVNPSGVTIFSFAIKGNSGDSERPRSALEQLEFWKTIQLNYCEHKPSITVTVKEEEWLDVAAWVWRNMDIMSGVAFLPDSNTVYAQMPYEAITEDKYNELIDIIPQTIDWSKLSEFEAEDTTTSGREFACTGDVCEVVGSA